MEYLLHILILIGIYVILSISLNLISGFTGLISLAHAGFYGVGAYVASLMALNIHSPFLVNVLCAIILSGILGALVGAPALRIHDDYFVIATFAFQVIIFSILNNWVSFTGGPIGLAGIPQPIIFGWNVSSHIEFLLLIGSLCALTLWVSRRVVNSPFGRVLKAIREDEIFAQAAGKNVAKYKLQIFVLGAGMAAVAGAVYACYITFIDPTSFTIMESIFIISIIIIGGAGSLWGTVIGAVVLVTLPEVLRFAGLPATVAANIRQIIYGSLLIGFMMWRPKGLLGEYSFQRGGPGSER